MPRSDVALRNGTGCTGTARLQTEAACQTISTRADLAATFFFAAQATFALILSPYFYQRSVASPAWDVICYQSVWEETIMYQLTLKLVLGAVLTVSLCSFCYSAVTAIA